MSARINIGRNILRYKFMIMIVRLIQERCDGHILIYVYPQSLVFSLTHTRKQSNELNGMNTALDS